VVDQKLDQRLTMFGDTSFECQLNRLPNNSSSGRPEPLADERCRDKRLSVPTLASIDLDGMLITTYLCLWQATEAYIFQYGFEKLLWKVE